MRVLVVGGEGMLGHKVFEVFEQHFEAFVTLRCSRDDRGALPMYDDIDFGRVFFGVDAFRFQSVVDTIAAVGPAVVVNCIGIVKQLEDAKNPIISIQVNALFPHFLAEACDRAGARLVQISTDCVFSGKKGWYKELDFPDADDLYGRTKLLGEITRPGHLTLRTSIFGRDPLKQTALLEWFISHNGGRVKGYKNAIFTGFPTPAFARILVDTIKVKPTLEGLYHVAGAPITKYDLLLGIRDALGLEIEVEPHDDSPCDRSLCGERFIKATGFSIPKWEEMFAELANDPTPYDEWRRRHECS